MAEPTVARAVEQAAANADFLDALRRILDEADAAARGQGFACRACGQCCRFGQFGHKLYVTTGELALLVQDLPAAAEMPAGLCPHQLAGRCSARADRALGCRLFFCDPSAERWFGEAYEWFHQRIKLLHEAHAVPYVYAELVSALAETNR